MAALGQGFGVSCGMASWPDDGPAVDMLLLRADVSLYAAKHARQSGEDAEAGTPTAQGGSNREPERAQLEAYAAEVRQSYARELHRTEQLQASYPATVQALAAAVEAKDDYTGGHLQRVHSLGLLLARKLAPNEAGDPQLAYGFRLHDIGKLAVPDSVLGKPGKLTAEEWSLIHTHPEAGAGILSNVPFLDRALEVVLHHHERWDGGGYPAGLAGEDIPLWARIFAVADTVDAMTSDRPYRQGLPLSVTVEEVLAKSGTQFDPACARALSQLDRDEISAALGCGRARDGVSP